MDDQLEAVFEHRLHHRLGFVIGDVTSGPRVDRERVAADPVWAAALRDGLCGPSSLGVLCDEIVSA